MTTTSTRTLAMNRYSAAVTANSLALGCPGTSPAPSAPKAMVVDGEVVLLPIEKYEAIVETASILSDKPMRASVSKGIAQIKGGRTKPWAQLKKELGL